MLLKLAKKIRPGQLFTLAGMFIWHPLYAVPTIRATVRCMRVADRDYGSAHHGDNQANAFRHALWNILIARYCIRWRKGTARALVWTEKFTDWHESFSKSDPLSMAMDLHNNKVGRSLFSRTTTLNQAEVISFVAGKSDAAMGVTSAMEMDKYPNELVFISTS